LNAAPRIEADEVGMPQRAGRMVGMESRRGSTRKIGGSLVSADLEAASASFRESDAYGGGESCAFWRLGLAE
jgi:hypothetical protein